MYTAFCVPPPAHYYVSVAPSRLTKFDFAAGLVGRGGTGRDVVDAEEEVVEDLGGKMRI